jgi:hypothetical protein
VDPQGAPGEGSLPMAITNVAPRILAAPDFPASIRQGRELRYTFQAQDPGANDRLALVWSLEGPAAGCKEEIFKQHDLGAKAPKSCCLNISILILPRFGGLLG